MRILMTGCSSGFGKTVRERLIEQGHKVVGVGLGGPDEEVDFARESAIGNMISLIHHGFEPFDCLINNAGTSHIEFVENHGIMDFERIIRINLTLPFAITQHFIRRALADGKLRKVLFTTSMGAIQGLTGSPGYCASKAGLEGLIRALSRECAGRKMPFAFYGIAPGIVEGTKLNDYVVEKLQSVREMTKEDAIKYSRSISPLGRACTHEEMWGIFDYVVNKASAFETGTIYRMTGGAGI